MRLYLISLFLIVVLTVNAEPIMKFSPIKSSGDSFEMQGTNALSNDFIPIDKTKKYQISGSFKNPLGEDVTLLFGVVPFDKNKKMIDVISVSAIEGTDTVLAEDCSPEDKIIRVKNASAWKVGDTSGTTYIVFETNPEFRDLPNNNYSLSDIESITQKGDIWEIKLKEACGRDYQEGTSVRQHYAGNTFLYTVIEKIIPNSEWKTVAGIINPSISRITPPFNTERLRHGTAFIKIAILGVPSNKLIFKDIEFAEKSE